MSASHFETRFRAPTVPDVDMLCGHSTDALDALWHSERCSVPGLYVSQGYVVHNLCCMAAPDEATASNR